MYIDLIRKELIMQILLYCELLLKLYEAGCRLTLLTWRSSLNVPAGQARSRAPLLQHRHLLPQLTQYEGDWHHRHQPSLPTATAPSSTSMGLHRLMASLSSQGAVKFISHRNISSKDELFPSYNIESIVRVLAAKLLASKKLFSSCEQITIRA